MSDLQVLFLTRFAYPGLGSFQTEHDSVAARQAHLWAAPRMEARLRTLEHVCLRTLAGQTDGDFRVLVVTGDALPQPWRGRLERIVGALPQAELVFHPPENPRDAFRDLVAARIDPDGPPVMQVRQDDDDGIGRRFVARCRRIFADTHSLWQRHGRMAIDFNRGYAFRPTAAGPMVEPQVRAHLGVAQALILKPSIRRTALHFPHHKVGQIMPSITVPDAPMWLRGVDGTNDSELGGTLGRLRHATEEEREDLSTRFGLNLDALAASCAA